MIRSLIGAIGLCVVATHALAADPLEIGIGYLRHAGVRSTLSLVAQPADNDGIDGARLAIEDNNTTGKFLNQHFTLTEVRLKPGDDVAKTANSLAERNSFIILDLPADDLLVVADTLRDRGTVLFDAGAIDDRLREEDCRANLVHVAPTRTMLADALGQYLVWKQWKRWLLVVGSHDNDKLYARCAAPRRDTVRRQDRAGADLRGHRRRAAHRQRRDADPAPDPRIHPAGAGLRRPRCGRRERGIRILPALSHLGSAAGCRDRPA